MSTLTKSQVLDAYGISKAALNMLSRKLAVRLADRQIIVVSIDPGSVQTDMNHHGIISVQQAIAEMSKTVERLTMKQSGQFLSAQGGVYDW